MEETAGHKLKAQLIHENTPIIQIHSENYGLISFVLMDNNWIQCGHPYIKCDEQTSLLLDFILEVLRNCETPQKS